VKAKIQGEPLGLSESERIKERAKQWQMKAKTWTKKPTKWIILMLN
jgi:hypothetical protein